jgi:ornithine cyclodeaminase/alanine dehydrogenase-like protein (mu-crystallin family)
VPVLLLSDSHVTALLDPETFIGGVEQAFRSRGMGVSQPAGVIGVHLAEGGVHVKAAALAPDRGVFAAKVNANFPANPRRCGLPTIQGLVMLLDTATGTPLAVMESGGLTRLRTAAATAVAARYLARPDAAVLTIAGCGAQAESQLELVHHVRPLARVMAYDIHEEVARAFAARATRTLGAEVRAVADFHRSCRESDIIITCTPSRAPFLGPRDVPAGAFVAAVGADSPDKQELDPALFAGGEAAALVTDVTEQCAEFGELRHVLAAGVMDRGDVRAELGEIVAGSTPGRRHADERMVFDSTGSPIQDAAAGAAAYDRARTLGLGTWFSFRS